MNHDTTHRNVHEHLARFTEPFVVLAQAAALPTPTQGPFHHAPSWQHAKPGRWQNRTPIYHGILGCSNMCELPRMVHQLFRPSQCLFDPVLAFALAVVAAINPHVAQLREVLAQTIEQQFDAVAVHDVRRMHLHLEQKPLGINENMAFAPTDFLASVVATSATNAGGLTDWLSTMPTLG
jgi:hypothetical protein